MKELVGHECVCVFNVPAIDWPIPGHPAWVIVDAVDMPMVKMRSRFAGEPMWVNSAIIKTIARSWFARTPRPLDPHIKVCDDHSA